MIRDIINQNEEAQPTDRTLGLLHRDFPQCFNAEGKFDIAAFRELLTDKVDLIKEGSGFLARTMPVCWPRWIRLPY